VFSDEFERFICNFRENTVALDRIGDDALVRTAKSTALNPGIGEFLLGIVAEEQHSTYGRHQLVVMLRDGAVHANPLSSTIGAF
jgi:hypothetical protein